MKKRNFLPVFLMKMKNKRNISEVGENRGTLTRATYEKKNILQTVVISNRLYRYIIS